MEKKIVQPPPHLTGATAAAAAVAALRAAKNGKFAPILVWQNWQLRASHFLACEAFTTRPSAPLYLSA